MPIFERRRINAFYCACSRTISFAKYTPFSLIPFLLVPRYVTNVTCNDIPSDELPVRVVSVSRWRCTAERRRQRLRLLFLLTGVRTFG